MVENTSPNILKHRSNKNAIGDLVLLKRKLGCQNSVCKLVLIFPVLGTEKSTSVKTGVSRYSWQDLGCL